MSDADKPSHDVSGLAERIAEYAVAATHVYAMMSSDPAYLQRLRDREEAKKQEMMPHIAEMLAPLFAENERLRTENDEARKLLLAVLPHIRTCPGPTHHEDCACSVKRRIEAMAKTQKDSTP